MKARINISIVTIFITLSLSVTMCRKAENPPEPLPDIIGYFESLDSTHYYDQEIFYDEFIEIYGKWKLYSQWDGYAGDQTNFDYLFIKPFGIFGFQRNDSLLSVGHIEIIKQEENGLQVKFIADSILIEHPFINKSPYVSLSRKDTLYLGTPVMDGYQYHFSRE